jgi:hypothetical protein
MKSAIVGPIRQPIRIETASAAAMSRTPEPIRRVTKKKRDAVTWLAWPNRWARNW